MAKTKKNESLDDVFEGFSFEKENEEIQVKEDLEENQSTEMLQQEVERLKKELAKEKQKKVIQKEVKMAHKGGIFKARATTTYKGRTIIAGDTIKLREVDVSNRNLIKIGEFSIDANFEENLNGKVRNLEIVDDEVRSSYSR